MSSIPESQKHSDALTTPEVVRGIQNLSTSKRSQLVRSVSDSSLKTLGFNTQVTSETVRRIPRSISAKHYPSDELRQKATQRMIDDAGRRPSLRVSRDQMIGLNRKAEVQRSLQKFAEINHKRMPPMIVDNAALVDDVKRPEGRHDLQMGNVQEWMANHPPECRRAVAALINAIRYVPHAEFERNFIERTIVHLNLLLKKENCDYVAPMQAGKSNKLMYELAQFHLVKRPEATTSLVYLDYLDGLLKTPQPRKFPTHLVFFDDAIFSAEQMTKTIVNILGHIRRKNQSLPLDAQIPIPRFIIACAYMTRFGKERLKDLFEKRGLGDKITILAHITIPTIEESINDEIIKKMLNRMYWNKKTEIINDRGPKSRGVVYFDHKISDGYSFPKAIAEGEVRDAKGKVRGTGYELIPPIVSPYGHKAQKQ